MTERISYQDAARALGLDGAVMTAHPFVRAFQFSGWDRGADRERIRAVVGPPGTGKTQHLASLVREAAARAGSHRVAIVTLTNAAAITILERAGQADRLVSNMGALPKHQGTLHRYALSLARPGVGRRVTPVTIGGPRWNEFFYEHNPEFVVQQAGRKRWRERSMRQGESHTPGFDPIDGFREPVQNLKMSKKQHRRQAGAAQYELLRSWMVEDEGWNALATECGIVAPSFFREAAKLFTEKTERMLFHDIIERASAAVEASIEAGEPAPFEFVYVDEFQDFSPLELHFVLMLARWARGGCVLVGDPDQSVFGFRGAVPRLMDLLRIPSERTRVLRKSWRLPVEIAKFAQDYRSAYFAVSDAPNYDGVGQGGAVLGSVGGCGGGGPGGVVSAMGANVVAGGALRGSPVFTGYLIERYLAEGSVMVLGMTDRILRSVRETLSLSGIPHWNPYLISRDKQSVGGPLRWNTHLLPPVEGFPWTDWVAPAVDGRKHWTWEEAERIKTLIGSESFCANRSESRYIKSMASDWERKRERCTASLRISPCDATLSHLIELLGRSRVIEESMARYTQINGMRKPTMSEVDRIAAEGEDPRSAPIIAKRNVRMKLRDKIRSAVDGLLMVEERMGTKFIGDPMRRWVGIATPYAAKGAEADTVFFFPELMPFTGSFALPNGESISVGSMAYREGNLPRVLLQQFSKFAAYVAMTRAKKRIVLCSSSPRFGKKRKERRMDEWRVFTNHPPAWTSPDNLISKIYDIAGSPVSRVIEPGLVEFDVASMRRRDVV